MNDAPLPCGLAQSAAAGVARSTATRAFPRTMRRARGPPPRRRARLDTVTDSLRARAPRAVGLGSSINGLPAHELASGHHRAERARRLRVCAFRHRWRRKAKAHSRHREKNRPLAHREKKTGCKKTKANFKCPTQTRTYNERSSQSVSEDRPEIDSFRTKNID
jgi:hypothetical protein